MQEHKEYREYPKLSLKHDKFQVKIGNSFRKEEKLLTRERKKTREQLCFPKRFHYQLPQLFCKDFINPSTPYKSLLIYHKIGSGKTCAAIQIAEEWKNKRKVFIITPASLKSNLYKELRSECTKDAFVTKEERLSLLNLKDLKSQEYTSLIKNINTRINSVYKIYSHTKFISMIQTRKINMRNSLLIIDEVQNLISESGSNYRILQEFIAQSPSSLRTVLLTATPIMDKPNELALTMNILRPKKKFPIGKYFDAKFISKDTGDLINKDLLIKHLSGYVSYYPGAPEKVFPINKFSLVNCNMGKKQLEDYSKIGNISDDFFIQSRLFSNFSSNGEESCKVDKFMKKLKYARGTVFVYSNFKKQGGIESLISRLEQEGYQDFNKYGDGPKRFAIWSGDETTNFKDKMLEVFNSKENQNGKRIKILLGSPSIKEGVSLMRVRQVHLLEPHWNMSRIQQIIGRAIRFCSHKDVKPIRRIVKVFLYLAHTNNKTIQSVDPYILEMAKKKEKIIKEFENALKDAAIDKYVY
jgi:hypothetical protein